MKTMISAAGATKSAEKNRLTILKFLVIVFPLWLSGKYYNGPYSDFVRNYLTAIILIILLALIVQLVLNRLQEKPVLLILFIALGLLQGLFVALPELSSAVRFTLGPASFFGNHNSVNMIPYYGVGGFIGYFVLKSCRKAAAGME